jgi:hypothetical protein
MSYISEERHGDVAQPFDLWASDPRQRGERNSVCSENWPMLHKRVFLERRLLWFLERLELQSVHVTFERIHLGTN